MNVTQLENRPPVPTKQAEPSRMTIGAVTGGVRRTSARILMFGSEGVGKSTFAAGAPAPIWIGGDSGTQHLDVQRFPEPRTWTEVLEALRALNGKHEFKTVVLDPLGWIEASLLIPHVCATNNWRSIEEPGFGRGYTAVDDQWRIAVRLLEDLWNKGMHVVMLAHSEVKKFTPPDMESYERYQVALSKGSGAILRQWCDYVLFAREQEWVDVGKDKKTRGRSNGVRVFHSNKTAAFDAKARPALETDPLPLSWEAFAEAREKSDPAHRAARVAELKVQIAPKLAQLDADTRAKGDAFLAKLAPDAVERAEEFLNRVTLKIQETKDKENGQ